MVGFVSPKWSPEETKRALYSAVSILVSISTSTIPQIAVAKFSRWRSISRQRIVSPRLGVHKHAADALDRVKILLQRLRHRVIHIQSRSVQYLGDFGAGASVASPIRFCASTRREEGS
jgi:hypothetical protein